MREKNPRVNVKFVGKVCCLLHIGQTSLIRVFERIKHVVKPHSMIMSNVFEISSKPRNPFLI